MGTESRVFDKSMVGTTYAGSLAAAQFYFVKSTAPNLCSLATGASMMAAAVFGVLQNDPGATNNTATVRMLGITNLEVDGSGTAILYGDLLVCSTAGTGIKASANLQYSYARAMEATTELHIIEAFVQSYGTWSTAA